MLTHTSAAYQGLIGFVAQTPAFGLGPNDKTFMEHLYDQGQIEEIRFGLAFGTSGRGKQILGGVDDSLFEGELTRTPLDGGEWMIANTTLTVKGSELANKQVIWFDSGGPNVSVASIILFAFRMSRWH